MVSIPNLEHVLGNILKEGELDKNSVCAKFAHTASDGKTYLTSFYNLDALITDTKGLEPPATQKEATSLIKFYQNGNFTIFRPTPQTLFHLSSLLDSGEVRNKEIFDAFLVATMRSYNLHSIFTHNVKDFQKFKDIEVIDPFIDA